MMRALILLACFCAVACTSTDVYPTKPAEPPLVEGAPPPRVLDTGEALTLAKLEPAEKAIHALDKHPFDFSIDEALLSSFAAAEVEEDVLDYLRKRARVDWTNTQRNAPEESALARPHDALSGREPPQRVLAGQRSMSPLTPRIYRYEWRRRYPYYRRRVWIRSRHSQSSLWGD